MINPIDIISQCLQSVRSREIAATITARCERDNIVALCATAQHDGKRAELCARFAFDGDLVLMRGLGAAMDSLASQINQARHMGLEVA